MESSPPENIMAEPLDRSRELDPTISPEKTSESLKSVQILDDGNQTNHFMVQDPVDSENVAEGQELEIEDKNPELHSTLKESDQSNPDSSHTAEPKQKNPKQETCVVNQDREGEQAPRGQISPQIEETRAGEEKEKDVEEPPILENEEGTEKEKEEETGEGGGGVSDAPDLGEAEKPKEPEPKAKKPLEAITIMVGKKKLRLKIVNAPPRPTLLQQRWKGIERGLLDDSDLFPFGLGQPSASFPSGYFNENPYGCQYCGKNFSSRIKLLRHETEHTGQKPFTCNYCGKGFTHKQSLIMHERIHTGEKPFQCPICTKCFARQTNYNIHMKLHASGRRYFCSFCGKWYRTEHEMLDHQQTCLAQMQGQAVPTDKPLRYQCSYCEKMFHHRRDKNIHERTHTGERPYTCGYCGKGFTQSQALTIHIRTHTGERPYQCTVCGKDFRDSSALRKHEFVKHTNVRGPTDELTVSFASPASSSQNNNSLSALNNHGGPASSSQHLQHPHADPGPGPMSPPSNLIAHHHAGDHHALTQDPLDAAVFSINNHHQHH